MDHEQEYVKPGPEDAKRIARKLAESYFGDPGQKPNLFWADQVGDECEIDPDIMDEAMWKVLTERDQPIADAAVADWYQNQEPDRFTLRSGEPAQTAVEWLESLPDTYPLTHEISERYDVGEGSILTACSKLPIGKLPKGVRADPLDSSGALEKSKTANPKEMSNAEKQQRLRMAQKQTRRDIQGLGY